MKRISSTAVRKRAHRNSKIPGLWLLDYSGAVKIYQEEIVYCHHNNDVTSIYFISGRLTKTNITLKKIEQKLCPKRFYRCHRNYLINLCHAGKDMDKNDTLILPRRVSIPVSRRRKSRLLLMLDRIATGRDLPA